MIRFLTTLCFILAICLGTNLASAQEEPPKENTELQVAKFLASTEEEAIVVAQELDFLSSDFEHPSNMCGPLAGAILYENSLLPSTALENRTFRAGQFWLATTDRLDTLFSSWTKFEVEGPVWSIDFEKFVLKEGDLVYLEGGMFDHILVVTRVTADGRAYSVTNLYTEKGWIIQEILLYDSASRKKGVFFNEFKNKNSWTGQTGASKMIVYRRPTKRVV